MPVRRVVRPSTRPTIRGDEPVRQTVMGTLRVSNWCAAMVVVAVVVSTDSIAADPTNGLTREEAVALYNNVYLPGNLVTYDWDGDISTCDPGEITLEYAQATIGRVNYFRVMAGISGPDIVLANTATQNKSQQAAFMMAANFKYTHNPTPDWDCYTEEGAEGAAKSNLASGSLPPQPAAGVDSYIDDFGSWNAHVAHRRTVLYPLQSVMAPGLAIAPASDASGGRPFWFGALWAGGPLGDRSPTPDGVAWPPFGFVPHRIMPRFSNRWSWTYFGVDTSEAIVTMTMMGQPLPVNVVSRDGYLGFGSGDEGIVWEPVGLDTQFYETPPAEDIAFEVTITNVKRGRMAELANVDVPSSMSYTVIMIDPAKPGNDVPQALNDSYIIEEDSGTHLFDVLNNDSWGEDGAGSLSILSSDPGVSVGVDDGGTPADASDDRLSLTPDADFFGSVGINYEICDANADCAQATATVIIKNVVEGRIFHSSFEQLQ